ncbi:hypothetical protein TEA_026195 [Camellia sinensis var. sinensis]|uniref:Cytochrome P450 n=1 Tax=Camellia sinensis var. sinensis TaxID=542762 RepID=A0A4V3WRC4_CAMSN|nr:hypothetical protein TEA_026195 [Camellia sinensis var. sinensis]
MLISRWNPSLMSIGEIRSTEKSIELNSNELQNLDENSFSELESRKLPKLGLQSRTAVINANDAFVSSHQALNPKVHDALLKTSTYLSLASSTKYIVSELMANDLWAGSLGALMLMGLSLHEESQWSKKITGAGGKVGPRQGGSQQSMMPHDGVCASGLEPKYLGIGRVLACPWPACPWMLLSEHTRRVGGCEMRSHIALAVYGTLFEAEHRSTFYIPYWNIPLARWLVPRQRKFQKDLRVINDCLDGLIRNAKETRQETDVEKLQQRDYSNLKDASLLRFLVDMRGADVDDRQLRDDLMTMLIAGHETTAAVLTWAVFLLAQNPSKMKKAQAEIDLVLGQGRPSFESLKKLEFIRLIIVEALRLFPQPPLLIRRTLKSDLLPGGYNGNKDGYAIPAGTDIFLSVYNLHRSPYFWDKPHEFEPERFLAQKNSEGIEGWAGFDPSRSPGALYPNEIISDFSFLPFGGGPRKCVGDQFALMESTVALAMLLQNFDVELRGSPESVELVTGATIHTKNGLWCKLKKRSDVHLKKSEQ